MLYLNYNEEIQHGTSEFPIAFYHVDCSHPRYEMTFHWHKEYEILRVIEGSFELSLDNVQLTAHAGESVFIPNGAIHGGTPSNCVYECLVFDPDILSTYTDSCRQYLKKIKHQDIIVNPLVTDSLPLLPSVIEKLFHSISSKKEGYELLVIGCMFEIFGIIFEKEYYSAGAGTSSAISQRTQQLKSVFEYIEKNYASAISLQQMAQLSGMSAKYFCRYFQTMAHKTPMDYLNYYRIERACALLCNTDMPITTIAYDCGFNDCSYFIKTFKRYKHTTPKQYQIQMKP